MYNCYLCEYECVSVCVQRCGRIEGWKRVQDASGKLQGDLIIYLPGPYIMSSFANKEQEKRGLRPYEPESKLRILISHTLLSHTHTLSLPCAGFGFCEYGDPESTLRALRILHEFRLGDKSLVVKVDSKTRTDLLKYVMIKKRKADQETVDEAAVSCTPLAFSHVGFFWLHAQIEKEAERMDEKRGTEVLKEVTDDAQKVSRVH